MAEIELSGKNVLIMIGIALLAILLANNIAEIGNIVRPRGTA